MNDDDLVNDDDLPLQLMQPYVWADPYPFYRDLRKREPVHVMTNVPTIVFARHASVSAVLQDKRFSTDWPQWHRFMRPLDREETAINERILAFFRLWMQTNDASNHHRLRTLVNGAFTPRSLEGLRPLIVRTCKELLQRVKAKGEVFDLVTDFAKPLPEIVMCQLFGLDPADAEYFTRTSAATFAYIGTPKPAPGQLADFERELQKVRDYLLPIIEERRVNPGDDVISKFTQGVDGDALTTDEIVVQCTNILAAGLDTTTALISNGFLSLMRHPDQMALLRADRSLIPNAIEEFMRFESPSQFLPRLASQDFEFMGTPMKAGQMVFLALGAACRDEAVFDRSEVLDVRRPPTKPLSFGGGAHYCLGAMLARMSAQIAFNQLLDELPTTITLAESGARWAPNFVMRHLQSLPIERSPAVKGIFESREWPTTLEARVVSGGDDPILYGYPIETDLAQRGSFELLAYLSICGRLPRTWELEGFRVGCSFAAAVSAGDAPTHAAILARMCSGPTSAVTSTACIGLAELARHEVKACEELIKWLKSDRTKPFALPPATEQDRSSVGRLRTALGDHATHFPSLSLLLPRTAALIAVLVEAGLHDPSQIERALTWIRLPLATAEAMAAIPNSFLKYPSNLPPIEYVKKET